MIYHITKQNLMSKNIILAVKVITKISKPEQIMYYHLDNIFCLVLSHCNFEKRII